MPRRFLLPIAVVFLMATATLGCKAPCSELQPEACEKRADCTVERTHLADKEGDYETVACIPKP